MARAAAIEHRIVSILACLVVCATCAAIAAGQSGQTDQGGHSAAPGGAINISSGVVDTTGDAVNTSGGADTSRQRITGRFDDPERSPWLRFDDPGPFDALVTWFPPYVIQYEMELKDFIRSKEYAAYRKYAGDGRAIDAIYVRAMSLTANNTSAALLIATLATFDHYLLGLRVPVLNLYFPLTGESREDYAARVRNLPADFYADTPPGSYGDRDKLQHFFGSAFVAFSFESRGSAERVGDFIEEGEDAVIVDGLLDARDKRANWNGTEFGTALLANNRRYPSEYFRTTVVRGRDDRERQPDPERGCR